MKDFPLCPFDGKPCLRFGVCDVSFFAGDKVKAVKRCSRLKGRVRSSDVVGREHERERMRQGS